MRRLYPNYLISGGLGFIGSNFVNHIVKNDEFNKIVILDIKDYCSSLSNVDNNDNVEIVIGDISNTELVNYILHKFNINIIVHFAAQSHVDNSFFNSIEFTKTNVLGTHYLIETAKIYHDETNNIQKFIQISTDEVFGEINDDIERLETSIMKPTNPYASSKAAAEHLVNSYYISYKFPIITTRSNNVFGIHQYPEKIIPKFICQLLTGNKITIHGDGSARRDFIHVDDVVTAIEKIISEGIIGEIYNISADHTNEYTVLEVAEMLIKLIYPNDDVNLHIQYVKDRNFNDARYFISSDKLKKLGWQPVKNDFNTQIIKLIEWYKIHKSRYNF